MEKKLSSPVKLIKESFQIFLKKENLIYLLEIYLPLVPFAIFSAVEQYFFKSSQLISWESGTSLVVGIVYLLVYFLVGVAGICAVGNILSARPLSFGTTYESARKSFWKFSLLSIFMFLIIAGGFILLIIPGVIFSVWFMFSGFTLIEKNTKVTEALSQSKSLVKGNFWKVLGRGLVFGIFFGVLQVLVGYIPYGVGSVLTSLAGALLILPSYLLYRELSA